MRFAMFGVRYAVCGVRCADPLKRDLRFASILAIVSTMKIKYDKETDVIYINFSDRHISESDENKPGIIFDYDKSSPAPCFANRSFL